MTKPRRRKDYDYSSCGAYFITICAYKHQWLFQIPELRTILYEEWVKLPKHYDNVIPDVITVMHNHLHFIIIITKKDKDLKEIVGGYKSLAANKWTEYLEESGVNYPDTIWQNSFNDHIIRDEKDYRVHKKYILENPIKFQQKFNQKP